MINTHDINTLSSTYVILTRESIYYYKMSQYRCSVHNQTWSYCRRKKSDFLELPSIQTCSILIFPKQKLNIKTQTNPNDGHNADIFIFFVYISLLFIASKMALQSIPARIVIVVHLWRIKSPLANSWD